MSGAVVKRLARRPRVSAGLAAGALLALGWLGAAVTTPRLADGTGAGPAAPSLARPGLDMAEAARRLRAVYEAPPEAATADHPGLAAGGEAGPAPGESDAATLLRARLTAIVYRDGESGRAFWVIDAGGPAGARRRIALGEEFVDGWKVSQIAVQSVTLTRGEETLVVSLYASAEM